MLVLSAGDRKQKVEDWRVGSCLQAAQQESPDRGVLRKLQAALLQLARHSWEASVSQSKQCDSDKMLSGKSRQFRNSWQQCKEPELDLQPEGFAGKRVAPPADYLLPLLPVVAQVADEGEMADQLEEPSLTTGRLNPSTFNQVEPMGEGDLSDNCFDLHCSSFNFAHFQQQPAEIQKVVLLRPVQAFCKQWSYSVKEEGGKWTPEKMQQAFALRILGQRKLFELLPNLVFLFAAASNYQLHKQ